nr:receptor likey region, transmembrane domain- and ring domain-containing protein 3 [Quercus suber]
MRQPNLDSIPLDAATADVDVSYCAMLGLGCCTPRVQLDIERPRTCAFVVSPPLTPDVAHATAGTMIALPHRMFAGVALLCLAMKSMAQTPTPANFTGQQHETYDTWLSLVNGIGSEASVAALMPLTSQAASVLWPTAQLNLTSANVVLISCDPEDYAGFITASTLLEAAENAEALAIILYSRQADFCEYSDAASTYERGYTLQNQNDTKNVLASIQMLQAKDGVNDTYLSIDRNTTTRTNIGAMSATGSAAASSSTSPGDDGGPPPTTAVAMIILYSITGVITCLFLVIIVTGALRAHRHPERYGPRNILGRARQSRAQGLARAMLDSLPIVKVGEQENSKPGDVELGSADTQNQAAENSASTESSARVALPEIATGGSDAASPKAQSAVQEESGIAAAAAAESSAVPEHSHENEGCSICTEDFELGQDQRVLPCNHRFHPACIDPWLLNVSGTCPLCRIDLRPPGSSTDETSNENAVDGTAPPLGLPNSSAERERGSVRRSRMPSIISMGQPERMSRQQRISALRDFNRRRAGAGLGTDGVASPEVSSEEAELSLRRRLRNAFRIRTRRTGQPSDETMESGDAHENPGNVEPRQR